ncbi:MAG: NAD(+)/NADH kinase [Oscillospiraceae bacterium]
MTLLLIPNLNKENAVEVTKTTVKSLCGFGARVLMCDKMEKIFYKEQIEFMEPDAAFSACDAILTIGGDGTILHTAKDSLGYEKPLLGVNIGRMGFLATCEANEPSKLLRLVNGDYTLDRRMLLEVNVTGRNTFRQTALNDIVIAKSSMPKIIDIDIFCDDIPVNHYQGDGVVIATPTGSTAYSLSAGGPILDARISGMLVTPICAHSLNSPPMVFSAERNLRIAVSSPTDIPVHLCCDGRSEEKICSEDKVVISLSKKYISLICFNDADQFEAIDKKLKGR